MTFTHGQGQPAWEGDTAAQASKSRGCEPRENSSRHGGARAGAGAGAALGLLGAGRAREGAAGRPQALDPLREGGRPRGLSKWSIKESLREMFRGLSCKGMNSSSAGWRPRTWQFSVRRHFG